MRWLSIFLRKEKKDYCYQPVNNSGSTNSYGVINNAKINLNKADETELQNIPGIGPAKASAIIEYREINGPFKEY